MVGEKGCIKDIYSRDHRNQPQVLSDNLHQDLQAMGNRDPDTVHDYKIRPVNQTPYGPITFSGVGLEGDASLLV